MKILFFTSSRSEYGLLKNLIKIFKNSKKHNLKLVVSGSHLSQRYGRTVTEIKKDKILINKEIKLNYKNDTKENLIVNYNKVFKEINKFFSNNKIDLLVLLGDRYETHAAATMAMFKKIKIAHIHGGEVSAGAMDEKIRHSISKMSDLHFVSSLKSRRRLIQLGEDPKEFLK